jgi:hypothetical protein
MSFQRGVQKLAKIVVEADSFYDDPLSEGSDCGDLVASGAKRRTEEVLRSIRMTADEFMTELTRRTNSRVAYNLRLLSYLD